MEAVTLKAKDGYELSLHVYPMEHAKGCVQMIHGMEEHKERYDGFARKLNEAGYVVVVSDMRGHGKNAPVPGFFSEKNGDCYLLFDQRQITRYIKNRFGVKKVYLFAHSMGTIIARNLLQTQASNYEKVVLSGFPYDPGHAVSGLGMCICRAAGVFYGPRGRSTFISNLVTGSFNKAIPNPRTDIDWISYNEENIRAYQEDPYCGIGFTVSANRDLLRLLWNMSRPKRFDRSNAALPLLLIRGDADPCTGFEKGAARSVAALEKAGFENIRTKVYPHMRHEVLNEDGSEQVVEDIIAFFENHV